MAGKRVKDSTPKRATWIGFLDFRLSEAQIDELNDWQPSVAEVWEKVDALLLGGYKITLSYNPKFHTSSVTLIDEDGSRKSGGYGLSSSHTDGALALKTALFKHFVVLEGTWETLLDAPLTPGRIG